jgi:hypothetical protein
VQAGATCTSLFFLYMSLNTYSKNCGKGLKIHPGTILESNQLLQ